MVRRCVKGKMMVDHTNSSNTTNAGVDLKTQWVQRLLNEVLRKKIAVNMMLIVISYSCVYTLKDLYWYRKTWSAVLQRFSNAGSRSWETVRPSLQDSDSDENDKICALDVKKFNNKRLLSAFCAFKKYKKSVEKVCCAKDWERIAFFLAKNAW